ncbi:MAG: methyltransferase type 11 [Mucilaginibacter sp.]|uniref:methyltransferase type 11 n=1 Tax=Mucilaginibacter sp. TaxID=1882438 RepID=UPI0031B2383B
MRIKQIYSATTMITKMVEVFKTDVREVSQATRIIRKLRQHIPNSYINFDLEDCDNILRVEAENIPVQSVIKLLNNNGYRCEILT